MTSHPDCTSPPPPAADIGDADAHPPEPPVDAAPRTVRGIVVGLLLAAPIWTTVVLVVRRVARRR